MSFFPELPRFIILRAGSFSTGRLAINLEIHERMMAALD